MAIINSFFSYYNGTGTWHPSDSKYTLDHILLDTNSFRNIGISAGIKNKNQGLNVEKGKVKESGMFLF